MKLHSLMLAAIAWLGLTASAGLPVDADRACQQLVAVVQARHLVGAGKHGTYVCEHQPQASARFVFALRWRGDGLPEAGSNLVGYYQVDAITGSIHAWDLGEDKPGEALAPLQLNHRTSSHHPCSSTCRQQRPVPRTGDVNPNDLQRPYRKSAGSHPYRNPQGRFGPVVEPIRDPQGLPETVQGHQMSPALLPPIDWPALLRSAPYFSRALVDALHASGPEGFAPLVRAVYYFDLFDAQVSNGGVDQYFDNVAAHLDDADAVPGIIAANPVYAPVLPLIEEIHAIWNAVANAYCEEEDDDEDEEEDEDGDENDLLAPHAERMEAIATAFFALHHAIRQRLEEDIVRDPRRYFALAPVPGLRGCGVEHVALADGAQRLRFVDGFPVGPNIFENEDGGSDVVWFSPDRTLLQCETAGFGSERSRHWIHYPSQASSSWTTGENFMSGALQVVRNDRLALGLGHHGLHETFLANGQRESAALHWHGQELCSEHFYPDGSPQLRIAPHAGGKRWLRYWPSGALNTESIEDRDGRDRYLCCLDEHGADLAPGGTGRLVEMLSLDDGMRQWREGELAGGFLHGPVRRMISLPDGSGARETERTFYKNGRAQ